MTNMFLVLAIFEIHQATSRAIFHLVELGIPVSIIIPSNCEQIVLMLESMLKQSKLIDR